MKAEIDLTDECWLTLRSIALRLFDGDNSMAIEVALLSYFEQLKSEKADPDDTPTEEVLASLRRSCQQLQAGERVPLSEIVEVLEDDSEE